MKRLIFYTLILFSVQLARADEPVAKPNAGAAEDASAKSFFETRTKEDIQHMIDLEAQLVQDLAREMPAAQGAG